jgi:quercetin dioxygenase-like cupin family protein
MAKTGDVLENPFTGQNLTFRRAAAETGGELLEVESSWSGPGPEPPEHYHPHQEERFEVLEGELSFLSGRKWQSATAGEKVVVPAGTRHAYRNSGTELAHGVCRASPPQSLEEFLTEAAAMAREGKLTRQGLPKTPGAVVQALRLAVRHRKMVMMRWV